MREGSGGTPTWQAAGGGLISHLPLSSLQTTENLPEPMSNSCFGKYDRSFLDAYVYFWEWNLLTLLACGKRIDFCIFILYPAILLNSFMNSYISSANSFYFLGYSITLFAHTVYFLLKPLFVNYLELEFVWRIIFILGIQARISYYK